MNGFGIDYLSVFAMPPLDFVRLATDLASPAISLVLAPLPINPDGFPDWSLRADEALRREVVAATRDRNLAVSVGEGFVIMPGMDVVAFSRDVALMAELGAPRISVVSFDPDRARTFDGYATIAGLAASHGLETVVEFAPCFPSTPDLSAALAARSHVGRDDFRIMLDTMHFVRSGGRAEALSALDPGAIGYVQLCDGPLMPAAADYMSEAMCERRPPGEGEFPLRAIVGALPRDIPYGVEIPQLARAQSGEGPRARLERVVAATRALLDGQS